MHVVGNFNAVDDGVRLTRYGKGRVRIVFSNELVDERDGYLLLLRNWVVLCGSRTEYCKLTKATDVVSLGLL